MLAKTPLPSQAPRQNVVSLRQVSLHLRRHYLSPMSGGHWGLTLYNSLFQLGFAGTCCLSRQPCALSLWACRPQRPALLLCGPLSAGGPGWNAPTVRRSGASGKEKGWMPSPTPDCFPMEWVVLVTFLRASCGWEGTLWRGWSRTAGGGLGPCTHSQLAAPSWSQAGFPPALEPSPEQRLSLVQRSLSPPPPCVPAASQPKYGPTSEAQPPPRILWEDSARWSGTGHNRAACGAGGKTRFDREIFPNFPRGFRSELGDAKPGLQLTDYRWTQRTKGSASLFRRCLKTSCLSHDVERWMKTWSSGPGLSIVKSVGLVGGGLSCDMVCGTRSTRFHRNGFRVRLSSLEKPDLVLGRFLPTESVFSRYTTPGAGGGGGFPEEAAQMRRVEASVDCHKLLTGQCQRRHRLPSLPSGSVAGSHSPGEQQGTLWNFGTELKKAFRPLQIITNPSAAFLPSFCDWLSSAPCSQSWNVAF